VVRDHATLVIPPDLPAEAVAIAEQKNARLVRAERDLGLDLAARGSFQRHNFALAAATAEAFLERPLDRDALADAALAVTVPGRMEVVEEDPLVIFDGAHNPAGMTALAEALPEVVGDRPVTAVVSILDDKDARAMLAALRPAASNFVFTRTSNPRALSPEKLTDLVPGAFVLEDPKAALQKAKELGGAVVATGSIYLIADLVREPGMARASMI